MSFLSKKLISASGGGAPAPASDPDFPSVTALYHFDGTNGGQNNTFTGVGASGASQSWTRNGSPTQGSFSPFSAEEGKWSANFLGGDYFEFNNSDFAFGTNDFTIELWIYFQWSPSYGLFSGGTPHNQVIGPALSPASSGQGWQIYHGTSETNLSNTGLGALQNTWVHVAYVRASNVVNVYQNGVKITSDISDSTNYSNNEFSIGYYYSRSYDYEGRMSNFRVVNGTAVYTGAFSPPTAPLTAITNTKLLTFCSNRFKDKSTSAHTVSAFQDGTPKIEPFSPFAPSAEYDASTMGGSGTFDITNTDYLAATSSNHAIGTSDFTIEGWFYVTDDANQYGTGFFQGDAAGVKGPAVGQWNNGYQIFHGTSSTNLSDTTYKRNEWVHVALVRASNVLNLYQNGVKVTSDISDSTNYTATVFNIGWYYSTSYSMEGHISNFKMCLNASYTSAFSPPTALVTPTSGGSSAASTKILVNFTNAAIIDSSQKTNVQTVNNAQLDTSIKKFGTASAKFDGTGDYLHIPSNFIPIGTGDYTIELFAYFTGNSSTSGGLFATGNPSNAVTVPAMALRDTTGLTIYTGAGQKITGNTGLLSLNTWYHLAMVRASGVIRVFKDGSLVSWNDGSSTVSDTSNITSTEFVIGKYYSDSYLLNGHIDEFRLTLKARYTSNFTAPTKEYPNL